MRRLPPGFGRVVEPEAVCDLGPLRGAQVVDIFALGAEIIDRVRFVSRLARHRGIFEAAHERQVFAENVGKQGHEQVVKRLEAPAESDRLGERDIGLNLKVFGVDVPGRRPVRPAGSLASAAESQRAFFWPRFTGGAGSSPRSRCGTQSACTQPKVGWLTIALGSWRTANGRAQPPSYGT